MKAKKDTPNSFQVRKKQMSIRKAAVSGSFYPASTQILESKISGFLSKTKKIPQEGKLRILIVPHAGIDYSGNVAAWGFGQIDKKEYQRVILLGASHRAYFDHAAIDGSNSWETPLGKVDIDHDLIDAFIDENYKIRIDSRPHLDEHGLEIELIFLQKVLTDFTIIPVLVSNPSEGTIKSLADKISQYLDEKTLLVVSTDLSHYPPWQIANHVDNETIESILAGKKGIFERKIEEIGNNHYSGVETVACGYQAIRVALKTAEMMGLKDFKKIKYENSGDVTCEKNRVVGYVSIGLWSKDLKSDKLLLDSQSQKEALLIARITLEEYVKNKKIITVSPQNKSLLLPRGSFVTLRRKGLLRGCIGNFEPDKPLYEVIQAMTVAAASKDIRFSPVVEDELSDIDIEISVLSPREKIHDWKNIELGKHGVVIQKGSRSGTFLPQVADETGWSKEEFLSQLCTQKTGLSADCYKDPDTSIFTYGAQVFEEKREKYKSVKRV